MSELSESRQMGGGGGDDGRNGEGKNDLYSYITRRTYEGSSSSSSHLQYSPFIPDMSKSTMDFDRFVERLIANKDYDGIESDGGDRALTIGGVQYFFKTHFFDTKSYQRTRAILWPASGRIGFTPQADVDNLNDLANIPIIIDIQKILVMYTRRKVGLPQPEDMAATITISGRMRLPIGNVDKELEIGVEFKQSYVRIGDETLPSDFEVLFTRIIPMITSSIAITNVFFWHPKLHSLKVQRPPDSIEWLASYGNHIKIWKTLMRSRIAVVPNSSRNPMTLIKPPKYTRRRFAEETWVLSP
jgi:hypothetical protein